MLDASLGSCLLLAAKFNDDMKRDKIKELIEVIVWFYYLFMAPSGFEKVLEILPDLWKVVIIKK